MEETRPSDKIISLSTGQTVDIPLYTEATMTGVVFSVSLDSVRTFLPSCLSPVRVGPQTATVMFLCTEYHSVNRGMFEPYDEFGVLIPATRRSTVSVPFLSRFPGGVGGYVWYLPVTTEPSRALGDEVWGYPKVVGDIDITDIGSRRRTTVTIDGDHFITVEIKRPPTVDLGVTVPTESYTERNGTVIREPLTFEGEMGLWSFSTRASYSLGEHPRADQLRQLDIGDRVLVRCYGSGTFVIHPGEPLSHIE
jgi:hypothetical protein